MGKEIRILLLEDNPSDAELVKRELRKAGFDSTAEWAPDKGAFLRALESFTPDIVLVDYLLPGFDGLAALALARRQFAEIPVVVVSGAVGEEVAIEALKAGATDYVLKQRLSRLGPVVHRALAEARERAQKRQAEEALRRSEERFRLLVEGVQDYAIFMLDPQGRIVSWNAGAERLKGWSAPEVLGRHVSLFHTPAEQESGCAERALERAAAEGRYAEQAERVRKNGQRFWADVVITTLRDESGRLYGFAKIIRDITERKHAEEALREANATLESKVAQRTAELEHRARQLQKLTLELSQAEDRERRRLAEILHDDLQQVLAAAKFHLGALGSGTKHDPSQRAIIVRVDQMLTDAIQKSRSLSHELSPAVLHQGDLGETFAWLADQMRTKHGLCVTVDVFGDVGTQSDALKTFLYKAGRELLFNVVKHARADEARIRVRRLNRYLCLSVSDRGNGFDPQALRETTGFGLLSIRERIELLGGRMKIRSIKGGGSTFHIVVPDGPGDETKAARRDWSPKPASRGSDSPFHGKDSPSVRALARGRIPDRMATMEMYPLKLSPVFKPRIWGGQRMREVLGKELPAGERIGESWEIADLPEGRSTIANGALAGQMLGEVVRRHTQEIMGKYDLRSLISDLRIAADDPLRINNQQSNFKLQTSPFKFPLLVKFIDAQQVLSVQVHPDGETCRRMGKGNFKTECWYIIQAEPGAVIYKGLRSGVTRERFAQAIHEGNAAELLAAVSVSPGECHFIPAGVVHTLGAGLLIAEVQTPSDTTYRVFDWNRVDDSGKPRPLHVEEALESIHFDVTPDKLPVTTVGRLVDCEYFKMDKGHRAEGGEGLLSRGLMRTLIFIAGGGTILSKMAEPVDFAAGDCLVIPAAFEGAMRFAQDTEYLTVTL